jgi:hypothetical protein
MEKRKKDMGQARENVVDYRYKNVTRLNIPPAGLAVRGPEELASLKKSLRSHEPWLEWAGIACRFTSFLTHHQAI